MNSQHEHIEVANAETIVQQMFYWWLYPQEEIDFLKIQSDAVAQDGLSYDAFCVFAYDFPFADRFFAHLNGKPDDFGDLTKAQRLVFNEMFNALAKELEPYLVKNGTIVNDSVLTDIVKKLMRDQNVLADIKHQADFPRGELPKVRYSKKTILEALDKASLNIEGKPRSELGHQVRKISLALKRTKPMQSQDLGGREL